MNLSPVLLLNFDRIIPFGTALVQPSGRSVRASTAQPVMRTFGALLLVAACAAGLSSADFHELKPEQIRQSTIDNFPKLFSLKVGGFLHWD